MYCKFSILQLIDCSDGWAPTSNTNTYLGVGEYGLSYLSGCWGSTVCRTFLSVWGVWFVLLIWVLGEYGLS